MSRRTCLRIGIAVCSLILVGAIGLTWNRAALAGLLQTKTQEGEATTAEQASEAELESEFDAKLAKELGADPLGMRKFVFCTLVTGPAKIADTEKRKEIFDGHFSNMGRLAEEGKLVLAGPFIDGQPKRGMYIFNVTTIEDAEALVKSDPAVAAGVFDYELTKLYASAALMKINEIHTKIQRQPLP